MGKHRIPAAAISALPAQRNGGNSVYVKTETGHNKGDFMEHFVFRDNEYNKRKIIEMVDGISDDWILKQIYRFIINMTKEGG